MLDRKDEIIAFLQSLRERIIHTFQSLEIEGSFQRKKWDYSNGTGGGEIGELRGKIFERAAVNWSAIQGDSFPLQDGSGPFFATGVSLITHMRNPHAPTVHMNLRYIETREKSWFGGGYDLTPMGFPYQEDTLHFHKVTKEALDTCDPLLYSQFAQNAASYFFIPHREKQRGVGGIFFDHFNRGDFEIDLLVWKTVGEAFLEAILPIYQKRIVQNFTERERELQLKMRGHYVEFNLLYDRGTQFGFRSGGNSEAILCSLPPLASW